MAAVEAERQRRGLTHKQVAEEHLRVTYTTLCYWRRGGPSIGGNVALRIARFCDIDLRDYARMPADPLPAATTEAA